MPRYRTTDLNLLKVFEALMTEGSVSRAADKLALTQPSVSNALKRLRDTFEDPLFVRTSGGVRPTLQAYELWSRIAPSLQLIRESVDGEVFDAREFQGELNVAMSDFISAVVSPPLINAMREQAPQTTLQTLNNSLVDFYQLLENSQADFVIGVNNEEISWPKNLLSRQLWTLHMRCFMRADHPLARHKILPLHAFLETPHVDVSLPGKSQPSYDMLLNSLGTKRHLAATVNHYLVAYEVLRQTDLIAVMPWSDSPASPSTPGLVCKSLPIEAPPRIVEIVWHQRHDASARHQWFKALLLKLMSPTAKAP